MRISIVAKNNGFDKDDFEQWVEHEKSIKKRYDDIVDSDVERAIELYKEYYYEKQLNEYDSKTEEEKAEIQAAIISAEENKEKQQFIANMLITSGFNFDGYTITKYSGYISGDDAVSIPRTGFFSANNNCQNLTDALVKIRRQALKELKEAAYDLGCNAVIGVDFDYITLEPEHGDTILGTSASTRTIYEPYVICVTANGNAVVIEKNVL